jgi:hypothetical protein
MDCIQTAFPIRDLGDLHYFLGIEVARVPAKFVLSQSKYIEELLQLVGLTKPNGCSTLMATLPNLSKHMGSLLPSDH